MKLYIATHKNTEFPDSDGYIPIEVGRELRNDNISNIIGDNTGENISHLNESFCELTALYWIWKNEISSIVGLVHYRRYFIFNRKDDFISGSSILSNKEVKKTLESFDVILPKRTLIKKKKVFIHTVKKNYKLNHHIKDWILVGNIIKEKYPDYYPSFRKVESQRFMYCYNMMVTRKDVFDDYCCWLFDILLEMKDNIDIINYDSYQKRIFGFISERLLNVYFHRNSNYRIKTYNVNLIK